MNEQQMHETQPAAADLVNARTGPAFLRNAASSKMRRRHFHALITMAVCLVVAGPVVDHFLLHSGPALVLEMPNIDLGTVPLGCQVPVGFRVRNTTGKPQRVVGVEGEPC